MGVISYVLLVQFRMSNFAPSRAPKKGVCEWRIVSLATKTFWWNFTCCNFTSFFKFIKKILQLILLSQFQYYSFLFSKVIYLRNIHDFLQINFSTKISICYCSESNWIWKFEKKIVKQQKVFDGKLGDKHQKWVQQQWRRYSTSPGSVCVLSLC